MIPFCLGALAMSIIWLTIGVLADNERAVIAHTIVILIAGSVLLWKLIRQSPESGGDVGPKEPGV